MTTFPLRHAALFTEKVFNRLKNFDARQFKPKQLAEYLLRLDQNDILYNDYFWYKEALRRRSWRSADGSIWIL